MLNHDDLCAYLDAAYAALDCVSDYEFNRRTGIADGNLKRYRRGVNIPSIGILRRIEQNSGISLDQLDPRLHRGLDYMGSLRQIIGCRGWSQTKLCETVGIGRRTVVHILNTGTCPDIVRAVEVIALCDMVEGRLCYGMPRDETRYARKKAVNPEHAPAPLPPEARGDRFFNEAARVFAKFVNPLPALFHLRTVAPGTVEGYGDELTWRVEKTAGGTTLTCMWRKNGEVCGQWTA